MIEDQKISDAKRLTGLTGRTALTGQVGSMESGGAERLDHAGAKPVEAGRDDPKRSGGKTGANASVGDGEAIQIRLEEVLATLHIEKVDVGEAGRAAVESAPGSVSTDQARLGTALRALVAEGVDRPPLPGSAHGATLARWRMLAAVASTDVALVKLYEGHTDALAILAELRGTAAPAGSRWAVWAAEPPNARLTALLQSSPPHPPVSLSPVPSTENRHPAHGDAVRLHGRKAWCSGAAQVTHALVTAWIDEQPCLVAVAMDQPGITVTDEGWHARGMAATGSVDVLFDEVNGVLVGAPGAYLSRPGFWHGGAGIAACWMGAAAAIARYTMDRLAAKARKAASTLTPSLPGADADAPRDLPSSAIDVEAIDDLSALYAAELDLAMSAAATLLRETAAAIDANPQADARNLAMRARLDIEALVDRVLRTAGRALGAAPLCRDARFAALMADLPVFLRQSHAERDLAAYGRGAIVSTLCPAERSALSSDNQPATRGSRWTL